MRKCKDRVLALSLAVFVFVTMAVSFGTITASAADGYTLHFFDTLEDGASCLGTYADYGKDSVYGPAPYDTEYGYGNGIKIVADGNKSGYSIVFDSAIAIEEGKYVEIEYDYTQSAGTGSTGQYKLDLNSTQFAYYQGNGSMYLTTSTGVHTMVSASVPVAYHRYKFTLRAVRNETNELSWEVCSLLIDGEEILKGDYSGPYSAGAYKGDIGQIVFRRGSSNKNAIAYWDNISVISYFPVDGTSPAPDRCWKPA